MLNTHFDVAHLLGHPAFEHLAKAIRVYIRARQSGLLDLSQHHWQGCLSLGGQLEYLRREELSECVQAVILFQAMMEKLPYYVPQIGTALSAATGNTFAEQWISLLGQIRNATTQAAARNAFDFYHREFYKKFRNPIIHGRTQDDINKVNQIKVSAVYLGMQQGWRAYDDLLAEAFAPQAVHQPSWATMCSMHGIADTLDPSQFPDLFDLSQKFCSKHLHGARAAIGH